MKWQQRLNEHEVAPHPQVWDALKDRLTLQNSNLSGKLLDLEVQPPPHAWNDIRNRLEAGIVQTEAPRIPLIRRISQRYASAAAMAASVILLTVMFLRESDKSPDQSPAITSAMNNPLGDLRRPADPALKSAEEETAREPVPERTLAQHPDLPVFSSNIQTSRQSPVSQRNVHNLRHLVQIESGSNYIRICSSPGECDRLTYKLEEWAPCIHDQSETGPGTLQRTEKERRIESWRRSLEQSDYIPAAGHFFDILEMASMLNRALE